MNRYFQFVIVFTMALSSFCFSQATLSGLIKDSTTGVPIQGVLISINALKITTQTNFNGEYVFPKIPFGTYTIEAKYYGFFSKVQIIKVDKSIIWNPLLSPSSFLLSEVCVTGISNLLPITSYSQPVVNVSQQYLNENISTNVIDAISKTPGVSAISDGQSISKPIIRGLGYNRVLTINDGVIQVDQPWFDEFGIEADPNSVDHYEILKGPASLIYGPDAIGGVVNLLPEMASPEGKFVGDFTNNYQSNNGLINNMFHFSGTSSGISFSGRIDNIMAHSYQNPLDGYALNTQFNNFNTDGTVGIHKGWGFSQLHLSYFNLITGIVDGTRDSASGAQLRSVSIPNLNGGSSTYIFPTHQEEVSYTPFVIFQKIQHTKLVWDNSVSISKGKLIGVFSFQRNNRQETNDPTEPNISQIFYLSNALTFDFRYSGFQFEKLNYTAGINGLYQNSQSLGTLMLIPNYSIFQVGGFALVSRNIGKLSLNGGFRLDNRLFNTFDHWVDSAQVPVLSNSKGSIHEFSAYSRSFTGPSFSFGSTYDFRRDFFAKFNIAQGFRAPNVSEFGANGIHDGTVVWEIGDPNLKPEYSLEEDISFGANGKDVSFEIDLFNNDINNFIFARGLLSKNGGDSINNTFPGVSFGPAPVYKYTQGHANLYGGEFVLNIHPRIIPWLEFNGSISLVQGGLKNVPDSIKVLPFMPPTRLTLDWKFKLKTGLHKISNSYFKIGLVNCFEQSQIYSQYAIYNGLNTAISPQEYLASHRATPGYTLINLGMGSDFMNRNGKVVAKVYINVSNLFDSVYMDYMSRFKYYPVNYLDGRVGVFNMGRNVSFKLIIPIDFKN